MLLTSRTLGKQQVAVSSRVHQAFGGGGSVMVICRWRGLRLCRNHGDLMTWRASRHSLVAAARQTTAPSAGSGRPDGPGDLGRRCQPPETSLRFPRAPTGRQKRSPSTQMPAVWVFRPVGAHWCEARGPGGLPFRFPQHLRACRNSRSVLRTIPCSPRGRRRSASWASPCPAPCGSRTTPHQGRRSGRRY